ncbi:MAG: NAD(P)-dependent oxidoreductase [Gemmatimonadota bacterium]
MRSTNARSLTKTVLPEYRGVPVLVTGATGFIGRAVCQLLADSGAEVWAVSQSDKKLSPLIQAWGGLVRSVVSDLAARGSLSPCYRDARPAVTFNLAGYGVAPNERDARLADLINAQLPGELTGLAAEHADPHWSGHNFVQVGSGFEYGSVKTAVMESTPESPANLYARTKLAGSEQVRQGRAKGAKALVARVFTVYGPGEHTHRLLPSLIRTIHAGGSLELTAGEQERDFTFVGDIAEGLLRLGLLRTGVPLVNLATGVSTTVRAFAETAIDVAGGNPAHARFGALPYRSDEVWQGPVNVELLKSLLGWVPPTTVRAGIIATNECTSLERAASA